MYWNEVLWSFLVGRTSWIVTLDVLKWFVKAQNIGADYSWIVTLDVLKCEEDYIFDEEIGVE